MFDTEVGTEIDQLEAAIDKVFASEQPLDVARMCRLAERVEFLKLRAIGEFDRSGAWQADGFVSTASALRAKCAMVHSDAHGSVVLARKLDVLPEVSAAFGAGEISRRHAAVIAAGYTPERAAAMGGVEAELVTYARLTDASRLRGVVRRLTDALDGDGGAASDRAEWRKNEVTLWPGFEGRGMLHGTLDAESTEIACTALNAMMHTLKEDGDTRELRERRAEAFVEICRRSLAQDHTDDTGRRRALPHLSVVADLAELDTEHAQLVADLRADAEHVGRLSRATLERLLCDCSVSRVVMDGPSLVLDVGRATRNVSDAQWRALVARDRHCTQPGCTIPAGFCEAHHIWYWSLGGPTDLNNLRLLCWKHHRQQHANDPPRRQ